MMTRREAISIIRDLMERMKDQKCYQALYLAVKALETLETMNESTNDRGCHE